MSEPAPRARAHAGPPPPRGRRAGDTRIPRHTDESIHGRSQPAPRAADRYRQYQLFTMQKCTVRVAACELI